MWIVQNNLKKKMMEIENESYFLNSTFFIDDCGMKLL